MGQRQSALRRRILAHLTQQHTYAVTALLLYCCDYSTSQSNVMLGARARTRLLVQEITRTHESKTQEDSEERELYVEKVKIEMKGHLDRMERRNRLITHWKTIFQNRTAFPCTSEPDVQVQFTDQSDIELFTQSASPILRLVECIAFQQDIESEYKWGWMRGKHILLRDKLRVMLRESSQLIDILVPTITNEKEAQAMLHTAIGSLALQHVAPIMQRWNLNTLPVGCNSLLQTLLSFEVHNISLLPVLSLLQFDLDPTDQPSIPAPSYQINYHVSDDDDHENLPVQPTPFVSRSALEWARDDIRDEDKHEIWRSYGELSAPPRLSSLPADYDFSDRPSQNLCTQLLASSWWEVITDRQLNLNARREEYKRRVQFSHAFLLAWKQHSRRVYERILQADVMIQPLVDLTAEYLGLDWQ